MSLINHFSTTKSTLKSCESYMYFSWNNFQRDSSRYVIFYSRFQGHIANKIHFLFSSHFTKEVPSSRQTWSTWSRAQKCKNNVYTVCLYMYTLFRIKLHNCIKLLYFYIINTKNWFSWNLIKTRFINSFKLTQA